MTRMNRAAITDALRERIVNSLHVGRLSAGDRLPGTRALAAEFGVNARVVLAAMKALADDGFIVLRPRSGAFVGPVHPAGGDQTPDLGVWLVNTLLQARARGVSPRRMPDLMRQSLQRRHVRAACIECNDDQLHLLCSELARDHGFVTRSVEAAELEQTEHHETLRRADVLVTTPYHSGAVRVVAERLGKPWITVALHPGVMQGVAAALMAGPLYYVATDPRFEHKLRHMLSPLAPLDNLRVVVLGRDDIAEIPDDAASFIMTSARTALARRYGRRGGPGRPIQPPRLFSEESARELLTFLIRANAARPMSR